jgi:hypothetical protein
MITCLIYGAVCGNEIIPLTTEEIRLDFQLQSLQWKVLLSSQEKEKVISAIASGKAPVVRSALLTVGVHRVNEAMPVLEKGINVSDVDLALFAQLIVDAVVSNNTLDTQLEETGMPDGLHERDRRKVKEYVTQTMVIRETKARRRGAKTQDEFERLGLTDLQIRLLKDAERHADVVIHDIISMLSTAKIAGGYEYDLVTVLRTYEPNSVEAVIQVLSDKDAVNEISLYGRVLLLDFLDSSIYSISVSDREYCKTLFERFLNDDTKVSREAFWALRHIENLEALEASEKN